MEIPVELLEELLIVSQVTFPSHSLQSSPAPSIYYSDYRCPVGAERCFIVGLTCIFLMPRASFHILC